MTSEPREPIARVSVLSTGSVAIRPQHVGPTRLNLYVWLATSRRWTDPRPINAYVVEHREGLLLFDTGQDRASVTDPDYFPGGLNGLVYSRLAKFAIAPDETLRKGLARLGYDVTDVQLAVISHLHQDHIGGLPDLGQAELLISRREWESLEKPFAEARGLMPNHIRLPGLRWRQIDPEALGEPAVAPFSMGHDVFGDGSILLLPTPGHTPGSLSMLVRRTGYPPVLMVGDLTYDHELLAAGQLPGVGDKSQMRRAVGMVNALRAKLPDLVVLPAHDPTAAGRLHRALRAPPDAMNARGVAPRRILG
jgi:N-acyl homoserine lactone hydrolase